MNNHFFNLIIERILNFLSEIFNNFFIEKQNLEIGVEEISENIDTQASFSQKRVEEDLTIIAKNIIKIIYQAQSTESLKKDLLEYIKNLENDLQQTLNNLVTDDHQSIPNILSDILPSTLSKKGKEPITPLFEKFIQEVKNNDFTILVQIINKICLQDQKISAPLFPSISNNFPNSKNR